MKKADWLIENSEDIASLSPQSYEALALGRAEAYVENNPKSVETASEEEVAAILSDEVKAINSFNNTKSSGDDLMEEWEATDFEKEIISSCLACLKMQAFMKPARGHLTTF